MYAQLGISFNVLSFLLPAIALGVAMYFGTSLAQRGEPFRTESGPATGAHNLVFRALYALALAVLVAAFVSFGIEVVYPAPLSPLDAPPPAIERGEPPLPDIEGEPPLPNIEGEPLPPEVVGGVDYERELAAHNRVASAIAVVVAALILLAGLIPRLNRLPVIGEGVSLGGVLTLFYGIVLGIQGRSALLTFSAVVIGLLVLLGALYLRLGSGRTADRRS